MFVSSCPTSLWPGHTHRRTQLLRHKSRRSGVNMSKHVCDHKRFCCVHATLLLIMIRLHNDPEVQVAMYWRFAMITFSPRKFWTSSKMGPALPDFGDHPQLPIKSKRSLGFCSALKPILANSPRFIERSTIFPQWDGGITALYYFTLNLNLYR